VVRDVTGQAARGRRFSRAGDQSFWGIGIPSAFMALSGVPRQDTELSRTMERLFGTSGFPWWWHTREDTVDKIDADVLRLDTQVYVAAVLRTLDAPLVPIEPARAVRMLDGLLAELAAAAGRHADLAAAVSAAGRLVEKTEALAGSLDALVASGGEPARLEAANRLLLRLSRVLVPLAYTTGDRFAHDLALPLAPLAGLQRARDLGTMAPGSDAFRFAVAAVGRERNRVTHALEEAADLVDGFLSAKEPSP